MYGQFKINITRAQGTLGSPAEPLLGLCGALITQKQFDFAKPSSLFLQSFIWCIYGGCKSMHTRMIGCLYKQTLLTSYYMLPNVV